MISRAAARRLLIVGFWLVFGAYSGVQIQISMLSHHHSWARVISYQVVVWSAWIAFTFAVMRLVERWPLAPPRASRFALHGAIAVVFGVAHTALWVATELVLVPYDFMNPRRFLPRFEGVTIVQLPLEVFLYGLVALAHYADDSARRARERERQAAQLETSLAQARLLSLELQTQPHFLFNTLNGIGALVRTGQNAEALAMIGGLSDLLRYALDRAGGPLVTLEEEAGTVRRYLEIQSIRFADRLATGVSVPDEARRARVPALLLQPLVENSVKHGIAKFDAPGRVELRASRQGDDLNIEIFNTGALSASPREGIGVSTTRARLAELYGDRGRLELTAVRDGVLARITLPWSDA